MYDCGSSNIQSVVPHVLYKFSKWIELQTLLLPYKYFDRHIPVPRPDRVAEIISFIRSHK